MKIFIILERGKPVRAVETKLEAAAIARHTGAKYCSVPLNGEEAHMLIKCPKCKTEFVAARPR